VTTRIGLKWLKVSPNGAVTAVKSLDSNAVGEKLIVAQLTKKFSGRHGTGKFITVFTRACHWSLT
jgi:hypothetical protein